MQHSVSSVSMVFIWIQPPLKNVLDALLLVALNATLQQFVLNALKTTSISILQQIRVNNALILFPIVSGAMIKTLVSIVILDFIKTQRLKSVYNALETV